MAVVPGGVAALRGGRMGVARVYSAPTKASLSSAALCKLHCRRQVRLPADIVVVVVGVEQRRRLVGCSWDEGSCVGE